ncbi:hypothetical protein JCM1840_001587 [Sporobolomyces johnsonii]
MPEPPDEPPPPAPTNPPLPPPRFQPGAAPPLKDIISQDPLLKLIPTKRPATAASTTDAKRKRLHSIEDGPLSSLMHKDLDVRLQQEVELLEDKNQEGWAAAWTERAQAERSLLWGPRNMQTLRTLLREGKVSFIEVKRRVAVALNEGRKSLNSERGLNLPLIPLAGASTARVAATDRRYSATGTTQAQASDSSHASDAVVQRERTPVVGVIVIDDDEETSPPPPNRPPQPPLPSATSSATRQQNDLKQSQYRQAEEQPSEPREPSNSPSQSVAASAAMPPPSAPTSTRPPPPKAPSHSSLPPPASIQHSQATALPSAYTPPTSLRSTAPMATRRKHLVSPFALDVDVPETPAEFVDEPEPEESSESQEPAPPARPSQSAASPACSSTVPSQTSDTPRPISYAISGLTIPLNLTESFLSYRRRKDAAYAARLCALVFTSSIDSAWLSQALKVLETYAEEENKAVESGTRTVPSEELERRDRIGKAMEEAWASQSRNATSSGSGTRGTLVSAAMPGSSSASMPVNPAARSSVHAFSAAVASTSSDNAPHAVPSSMSTSFGTSNAVSKHASSAEASRQPAARPSLPQTISGPLEFDLGGRTLPLYLAECYLGFRQCLGARRALTLTFTLFRGAASSRGDEELLSILNRLEEFGQIEDAKGGPTRGEQERRIRAAQQYEQSQGRMQQATMASSEVSTTSTQEAPRSITKTCKKCEREGLPCDGSEPCQQCYTRGMFHLCIYPDSPPVTPALQPSEQDVARAAARRLSAEQDTLMRSHSDRLIARYRVPSRETQKRQPEAASLSRSPAVSPTVQPSTAMHPLQPQFTQREHQQQTALRLGHQSAPNTMQDGAISRWHHSPTVPQTGFTGIAHFRPPPSIPARGSDSIVFVHHTRTASSGSDEHVRTEPRRQSGGLAAQQQQQQVVPPPGTGPYPSIPHPPHLHAPYPSAPNSPVAHRFSTPAWRGFLPLIPDCLAGLGRFLQSVGAAPGAGAVEMPRSQPGSRPTSSRGDPGAGPPQIS